MSTIVDANATTLIAAIILASFGTGPIKGFAVTLIIGIITSFFSAVMVTRLIIAWWLRRKKPSTLKV
jgi:preprotein translocase subunit SecD